MENIKLKCDVCACKYNVNCKECSRKGIQITTGKDSDTAHYCASYCEK